MSSVASSPKPPLAILLDLAMADEDDAFRAGFVDRRFAGMAEVHVDAAAALRCDRDEQLTFAGRRLDLADGVLRQPT